MIEIRGTSHIAGKDLAAIRELVQEVEPDVVAVELDVRRLQVLLGEGQQRRGGNPFILLLKGLQGLLGRKAGTMPGSDMLAAVEAAQENGLDVALIDQDIGMTLQRVRDQVPLREKVKLAGFLVFGWLLPGERFALDEVPDDDIVEEALLRFRVGFPRLYRVLVEERNAVMAARLSALEEEYGSVLAFVGAGHVDGIRERLGGGEGS